VPDTSIGKWQEGESVLAPQVAADLGTGSEMGTGLEWELGLDWGIGLAWEIG
jgi:hypothetical protein